MLKLVLFIRIKSHFVLLVQVCIAADAVNVVSALSFCWCIFCSL